MFKQVSLRNLVASLFIIASLFFTTCIIFFFLDLSSGTSAYTAAGISAPLQLFFNMLSGYYFNTSLFASELTGHSVGFTNNPFPYLHYFAIHTHVSPFIFAPLWALWPNVYWLYGLVLCVNYLSLFIFTILTLKRLSPNSYKIKAALAITLLLSSSFLFTFQQYAQPLLFFTPFILGAIYFLWTKKKNYFIICVILSILISEDAALVVLTFSIYIYFFEHDRRWFAVTSGTLSFTYLMVVLFIVQPAARYYLGSSEANTVIVVLRYVLDVSVSSVLARLWGLAPALFFIITIPIICLLFPKAEVSWKKVVAISILPPLPHWGECIVVGATHHLAPVVVFIYAALIMLLGAIKDKPMISIFISPKTTFLIFLLFALFSLCNLRVLISNVPINILKPLYSALGFNERVAKIDGRLAETVKNKNIIKVLDTIPKDSSLVYLTNSSIEGFLADRTHIWKFPDQVEDADYILLQPSGRQSFFDGRKALSKPYRELIKPAVVDHYFSDSDQGVITPELAATIQTELVDTRKLYKIVKDTEDVVLLERVVMLPPQSPPKSTLGLGWVSQIMRDKK
jgi:hypothetical protein